MSYAANIASGGGPTNGAADPTLDRSYEYDNVGRLGISHTGAEARAATGTGQWGTMDGPYSQGYDYDVWGNVTHKYGWGGEVQGGGAGQSSDIYYSYANNRRNGFSYDAAGNLTCDGGQTLPMMRRDNRRPLTTQTCSSRTTVMDCVYTEVRMECTPPFSCARVSSADR